MKYRLATINDLDNLVMFRVKTLKEFYPHVTDAVFEFGSEKIKTYLKEHLNQSCFVYVCEHDNKLIACAFLNVLSNMWHPVEAYVKVGLIKGVYTLPEFRRRGIANILMEKTIAYARDIELGSLQLFATKAGYQIYKNFGFKEQTDDDDILMELILKKHDD